MAKRKPSKFSLVLISFLLAQVTSDVLQDVNLICMNNVYVIFCIIYANELLFQFWNDWKFGNCECHWTRFQSALKTELGECKSKYQLVPVVRFGNMHLENPRVLRSDCFPIRREGKKPRRMHIMVERRAHLTRVGGGKCERFSIHGLCFLVNIY